MKQSERTAPSVLWLKNELDCIDQLKQVDFYLDLLESGDKYDNECQSTVAYLLGITDEEPTQAPVGMEIHQGRKSMPDIDIDIDDRHRDKVIEYAKQKYGYDRVSQIITFSTIGARSAIKDAARVLGFDYAKGDEISKLMPPAVLGLTKSIGESIALVPELQELYKKDADTKAIIDAARGLEGVFRSTGMHAAGVIIAPGPIMDYMPVMQKGKDQPIISQWDMHRTEEVGMLKIDFLGLRNLGVMDMALKMIEENHGEVIDPEEIDLEDQGVYAELARGDTMGVFQIECVTGETLVSGRTIASLYDLQEVGNPKVRTKSVYLDEGKLHFNDIVKVVKSGHKKVYRLRTSSGRYINATGGHRFMTTNGWQTLDEINVGDSVLINTKMKTLFYNSCVDCQTTITNKAERCYSCSARFHSNPSKQESREAISVKALERYKAGSLPWNYGLTRDSDDVLKETGDKISQALKGKTWEDVYGATEAQIRRAKLSRKMSGRGNHMFGRPTSHTRGGFREDLGHYVRSSWEADYARILNYLGEPYAYEPKTFLLVRRDGSEMTYTPDFYLPNKDEYVEIKGFMRDLDQEKINLMAEQYPDICLTLVSSTKFAEFEMAYRDLVAWECPRMPKDMCWDSVVEIVEAGTQETYDIMMRSPGNNYLANGFMVHNSGGMQEMTVDVRPDSIEDLMAIQSLYRPGPMGSGMDKMFVNRKHGREAVSVPHPILKDILGPSYGIMLYQEDVLNATRAITGWGPADADDLRKVIGKKLMDKVSSYRDKFVTDAKKNDIPESISNKVFSDIEFFAGYGFNRAHAASYSILSYITAWLRHHYPAEYMAALLTSTANKKDKLTQYLNHCAKLDITIIPPSVDLSELEFTVDEHYNIVFGLMAIEGLGNALIEPLLESRPADGFKTMYGFFRDVDPKLLNKASMDHLSRSGALDTLVWFEPDETPDRDELMEILTEEKKEIGLYVTEHPLSGVWDYLAPSVTHSISDIQHYYGQEPVRLGGLLSKVEKRMTKANKLMYTLTFEDLTGDIQVMIFPQQAAKVDAKDLVEGNIGTLVGRVMREENRADDSLLVKMIYVGFDKLSEFQMAKTPPIMLKAKTRLTVQQLGRLSDIIEDTGGTSHVFLEMEEGDHLVTFKFKKATSYTIKPILEQIIHLSEATNG